MSDPRAQYGDRIRAIHNRLNVVDIVGKKVALKHGTGAEYAGLCPFHNERSPSFTVNAKKGFYHCFGCGEHGDAIAFVMRFNGLDFRQAVDLLESENGLRLFEASTPPPAKTVVRQSDDAWKEKKIADIWAQTVEVTPGSVVDRYLRGRELIPPAVYGFGDSGGNAGWPVDVRFHGNLWHAPSKAALPAMVSAYRVGNAPSDAPPNAVHRTYLRVTGVGVTKAGTGQDKMHLGSRKGAFIRLSEFTDRMVGGEGIETSLAAMQLFKRPGLAFGSADAMEAIELPFIVADFIYAADWNAKSHTGEKAAFAGAKLNAVGRRIAVKLPNLRGLDKADFNDVVMLEAPARAAAAQPAPVPTQAEKKPAKKTKAERRSVPAKVPLPVRPPAEAPDRDVARWEVQREIEDLRREERAAWLRYDKAGADRDKVDASDPVALAEAQQELRAAGDAWKASCAATERAAESQRMVA